MFDSIRILVREPLLHFFVVAGGLFLLFNYVSGSNTVDDDQIVVSTGQIEHFVSLFLKTRQRLPNDEELRGLIDNFVVEEMLYREAIAIGFDRDDTIIRRRLKQKMEFLLDDFATVVPTEADLQQFLQSNPERFRLDARISFEQVFLQTSSRDKAETVLSELRANKIANPDSISESHLIPGRFDDVRQAEVTSRLGNDFVTALFALDVGQWTGPIESPYGIHLLRIKEKTEGLVPPLAEIRNEVEREWLFDFRTAAKQQLLDEMKAKYTITIEPYEAG
jgi:hypothetical protein